MAKIEELEVEMKVLKNEVKLVLLDINEYLANEHRNPFSANPGFLMESPSPVAVPEAYQSNRPAPIEKSGNNGNSKGNLAPSNNGNGNGNSTGAAEGIGATVPQTHTNNTSTDLLTVAMLSAWLRDSISRIGKNATQSVVEIFEKMGGLTTSFKDVLTKLIQLDNAEEPAPGARIGDCISALVELDNLFWRRQNNIAEAAFLSTFLDMKNGNGKKEVYHR